MIKINSFKDLKGFKEEERSITIEKFREQYDNIVNDFRHGFISIETRDKELCKLISKTGLHIDLNEL